MHLPNTEDTDRGLRHRPRPPATTPGRFRELMGEWADGAGLKPSTARLDYAISRGEHDNEDAEGELFPALDRVGELVRALGFRELPAARLHRLDLQSPPFDEIVYPMAALDARGNAVARARSLRPKHPAEWETEAMHLEADLHLALLGFGEHSPRDLADRAAWVWQAREAERRGRPCPPRGSITAFDVPALTRHGHVPAPDPNHPLEGPGRRPALP